MELTTLILHLLDASVMLTIASVVLTIFVLGLSAITQDMTYLFHILGKLLRSFLSMNVAMQLSRRL